jgi:hypothetical protein
MASKRTARCAHCGETFDVPRRSGPDPAYCSQAHRQRAYELRRRTGRSEAEQEMAAELRELRARVRVLDFENKQLRQALNETTETVARLRNELDPPTEAVQRLAGAPHASTGRRIAEEPVSPRARKWWQPNSR